MAKLTDDQLSLLRKPVFVHLATVMPDGTPQTTPVWVDTDGAVPAGPRRQAYAVTRL